MTNQEALNRVWQYFVVERNPKGHDANGCAYLNPSTGARCAIGCLLPKTVDAARLVGTVEAIRERPDVREVLAGCTLSFLVALQDAHDLTTGGSGFPKRFGKRLRAVAEEFGLEVPA